MLDYTGKPLIKEEEFNKITRFFAIFNGKIDRYFPLTPYKAVGIYVARFKAKPISFTLLTENAWAPLRKKLRRA
jgi:hypothetical protein